MKIVEDDYMCTTDAREYFEKQVLEKIGVDFQIINKEMKLEKDLSDVLIYSWRNYKIRFEAPGLFTIEKI